MEVTPTAIDLLQEQFYSPVDIELVISTVSNNFFIIIAVILGVYPFLYIFRALVRYCEKAFDTEAIRKMESGGIWNRLPDGSLYTGLEKIAAIRVFDRHLRRK